MAGFFFRVTRPEPPGHVDRFRTILGRTLVRLAGHVSAWNERRRDRRLLASLDSGDLRDIGIERATTERESTTSFWRLR